MARCAAIVLLLVALLFGQADALFGVRRPRAAGGRAAPAAPPAHAELARSARAQFKKAAPAASDSSIGGESLAGCCGF